MTEDSLDEALKRKMQAKKLNEQMANWIFTLAKTEAGVQILRYLFLTSGFSLRSVVITRDGKVDRDATFWNDARRDMYLDLRRFMSAEVIQLVELDSTHVEPEEKSYA